MRRITRAILRPPRTQWRYPAGHDAHFRHRRRRVHRVAPVASGCSRAATRSSVSTTSTRSTRARTRSRTWPALRARAAFTFVEGDIRDAEALERAVRASATRRRRPPGGAGRRAPLAGRARALRRRQRQRHAAPARRGARARRRRASSSRRPPRSTAPTAAAVRGDGSLPDSRSRPTPRPSARASCSATPPPPLRHARHLPALLHRLRPAPAARPGDPQVHAPDRRGAADPALRRRLDARDYTFVDDIIDGVVAAIDDRAAPRPATASTTSAARARRRAAAGRAAVGGAGMKPTIKYAPDQPGDMGRRSPTSAGGARARLRPEGLDGGRASAASPPGGARSNSCSSPTRRAASSGVIPRQSGGEHSRIANC